jgi:hypothetical protein
VGSKKKSSTTGYRYYMGMHLVLCRKADAIREIQYGERTAWTGGAADEQIFVDAPKLWGGDKREGGIKGYFDVLMGGPDQGVNDYLAGKLGTVPAFRNVVSLVARRPMLSANNPYIKPIAVRVFRKVQTHGNNEGSCYGDGASPVGIIFECLTDTEWGMGYPYSQIDDESFTEAANQLYNESFCLNFIFTRQQPIRDFIQIVLDHIGGVLYQDMGVGGVFKLRLLRGDYDINALPWLGPHNVHALESFERAGLGETVNEVSVVYTDRATWKPKTVSVQNLANIQAQGGVVTRKMEYPGITNDDLAARVAARDLRIFSTPLARATLKVLRDGAMLYPGDVFRLTWPELGLDTGIIMRVADIDYGTLESGYVTIKAVEDVFAFDDQPLVLTQPGFIPPSLAPVPPDASLLFEVPYWEVARNSSPADLAYTQASDTFTAALAVVANDTQLNFNLYTGDGIAQPVYRATDDYAPAMTLPALPQAAADTGAIGYTGGHDLAPVAAGDYGYILDSSGNVAEAVEVLAIDTTAGTINLARGVLDTVPVAHPAGRRLIIVNEFAAPEGIIRAPGETVHAYIAPVAGLGEGAQVAVSNGPAVTLTGRQGLPYPPGNVQINGTPYPLAITGDVAVTWAHRDRLTQTGYIVHQDEGNIGPEPGVTYTLNIYGESFPPGSGPLLRAYSGIVGTGQTYTTATEAADSSLPGGRLNMNLTLELYSKRGTFDSWRKHRITVYRAGYGVAYGQHYGGL